VFLHNWIILAQAQLVAGFGAFDTHMSEILGWCIVFFVDQLHNDGGGFGHGIYSLLFCFI
jgi:hypothetical protein